MRRIPPAVPSVDGAYEWRRNILEAILARDTDGVQALVRRPPFDGVPADACQVTLSVSPLNYTCGWCALSRITSFYIGAVGTGDFAAFHECKICEPSHTYARLRGAARARRHKCAWQELQKLYTYLMSWNAPFTHMAVCIPLLCAAAEWPRLLARTLRMFIGIANVRHDAVYLERAHLETCFVNVFRWLLRQGCAKSLRMFFALLDSEGQPEPFRLAVRQRARQFAGAEHRHFAVRPRSLFPLAIRVRRSLRPSRRHETTSV